MLDFLKNLSSHFWQVQKKWERQQDYPSSYQEFLHEELSDLSKRVLHKSSHFKCQCSFIPSLSNPALSGNKNLQAAIGDKKAINSKKAPSQGA